jgi:large subunit ribosomal protein L18e
MSLAQKNIQLQSVITALKRHAIENDAAIWKRIAVELEKPCRNARAVNISRISRHSSPDDVVIVPGKVLSSGELQHSVTVAAYSFSKTAARKIMEKGRIENLLELARKNPKGTNIKIIG